MRKVQTVQRSEVQQVQPAFRSDPEPAEAVFADVADEVALEGDGGGGVESEEIVSVETAQTASRGRQPQETGVVLADIVDIVAGKAVLHRERASQISVFEPVLRLGGEKRLAEENGEEYTEENYTS